MNLARDWVQLLEEAGYPAVHWSGAGLHDDDDRDIIAWAAARGHVVLTADLDFGEALARSGLARPSVVQFRHRETRPTHVGAAVIDRIRASESALDLRALLIIESRRARVRRLPLGV